MSISESVDSTASDTTMDKKASAANKMESKPSPKMAATASANTSGDDNNVAGLVQNSPKQIRTRRSTRYNKMLDEQQSSKDVKVNKQIASAVTLKVLNNSVASNEADVTVIEDSDDEAATVQLRERVPNKKATIETDDDSDIASLASMKKTNARKMSHTESGNDSDNISLAAVISKKKTTVKQEIQSTNEDDSDDVALLNNSSESIKKRRNTRRIESVNSSTPTGSFDEGSSKMAAAKIEAPLDELKSPMSPMANDDVIADDEDDDATDVELPARNEKSGPVSI